MSTPSLGRLTCVELRLAWKNESSHFTPWLAQPENIALLAETMGLSADGLEVQGQEQAVGPFRADILCRNTEDNSLVLIENQLERTDHSHLGQLITYAAGLKAVTLVWIAERFTPEHRAALDWLNEITGDTFHIFGFEVELWRIGDSPLAPKFNVVVQPNEWAKQVRESSAAGGTTDADRIKLDFWAGFAAFMKERRSKFRPPKLDRAWNWHGWGMGRSYFQLCASVNVRDGRNAVWLNLSGPDGDAHARMLEAEQADLERELGCALEWTAGQKERKIITHRACDVTDRARWPAQYAWLHETMISFDRVFRPRVRGLDASAWMGADAGS